MFELSQDLPEHGFYGFLGFFGFPRWFEMVLWVSLEGDTVYLLYKEEAGCSSAGPNQLKHVVFSM